MSNNKNNKKIIIYKTLRGHQNNVFTIVGCEDHKIFASGGSDKTIKLWNIYCSKQIRTISYHKHIVINIKISQNY